MVTLSVADEEVLTIMTVQEDAAEAKAVAEAATMDSVVKEAARKISEEERKEAKVAEEVQRKDAEETARLQWREYIQSMEMTAGKSTDSKTIQVVAAYMVDKLGLDHPEVYGGMTQADFQRLDMSMLQMPAVALVRRTWATLEGAQAARNQVAGFLSQVAGQPPSGGGTQLALNPGNQQIPGATQFWSLGLGSQAWPPTNPGAGVQYGMQPGETPSGSMMNNTITGAVVNGSVLNGTPQGLMTPGGIMDHKRELDMT